MNKFDDFLKNKLSDASLDIPSNWESLNSALPVPTAGTGLFKWAMALLLLGGMVTLALVFNTTESGSSYSIHSPSASDQKAHGVSSTGSGSLTLGSVTPQHETGEKSPLNEGHQHLNESGDATKLMASAVPEKENITALPINPKPEIVHEKVVKKDENKNPAIGKETDKKDNNNTTQTNPASSGSPKKIEATTASAAHKQARRSDFHNGKLYLAVSFSPMLSYRSFQLNNGAAPFVNKKYDEIRQNAEAKIISYGAALSLEYKFSKNFSLQGGISYNKIGFKSDYEFDITDRATTDNTGRITGYEKIPTPVTTILKGKTQIDVLRIPFGINYNVFMNSNSLFHFYFGGAHDILLSAEGMGVNSLTLEQKSISKSDFITNASEVCIDLGVNIALTPKYAFGVDLYYNKWLTNISKSKLENVTPFTAGLNFAVSRKIF